MTRARGRDADMTQGNILRQYIDFALPLTVGLLFQQLYSAVDSVVVGNFVGETALGAVGSTGNIINMLIGVCNGLSLGAGAVISQAYGAKNHERISKAVHTTMLMTFLLCIVATAVGVAIVKPSLQLMRTPDSMLAEATEYLTIYFDLPLCRAVSHIGIICNFKLQSCACPETLRISFSFFFLNSVKALCST